MNSQNQAIKIEQVENGWVVSTFSYRGEASMIWVAETAEKLAALVTAWANNNGVEAL